jgi:hypothetical protein
MQKEQQISLDTLQKITLHTASIHSRDLLIIILDLDLAVLGRVKVRNDHR